MNPLTARFLRKAHKLLINASVALGVGLHEGAARDAYLSGYHAAQAFLHDRDGKVFKTHNGVQSEFSRAVKDDPRFDADMRAYLSHTYSLKQIADYEEGPGAEITPKRAAAAVERGKRFVECCEAAITALDRKTRA